jgi:four helix bundle protein
LKEEYKKETLKILLKKLKILEKGYRKHNRLKEADELEYWLYLCNELDGYENADDLLNKLINIKKILNKIVSSSKR